MSGQNSRKGAQELPKNTPWIVTNIVRSESGRDHTIFS